MEEQLPFSDNNQSSDVEHGIMKSSAKTLRGYAILKLQLMIVAHFEILFNTNVRDPF